MPSGRKLFQKGTDSKAEKAELTEATRILSWENCGRFLYSNVILN